MLYSRAGSLWREAAIVRAHAAVVTRGSPVPAGNAKFFPGGMGLRRAGFKHRGGNRHSHHASPAGVAAPTAIVPRQLTVKKLWQGSPPALVPLPRATFPPVFHPTGQPSRPRFSNPHGELQPPPRAIMQHTIVLQM